MRNLIVLLVFFGGFTNSKIFSQGLINNGAQIVLNSSVSLYVDGDASADVTNQNNGLFRNATGGGSIRLEGDWKNNASNVAFFNDGIAVNLVGANQSIEGSNSTSFYHLNLLGTGTKTLHVNTTVGGISTVTGVLALGTRPLDLNSNTLTISNPNASAITNSTGYIISETNVAVNPSIIAWQMGTSTGAHVYPFGVLGTQIPFTFNKTTAGSSTVSVSTRASNTLNLPWAGVSSVAAVTTMGSVALSLTDASSESVIDRWWDIQTSAATTANLIFSYRGIENTTSVNPTGSFSAQHWNGTAWDTQTGSGIGVTSGVGTVSVTGASTFSPWVLSSTLTGPLPVVLTHFSANCNEENNVLLEWTTASESNSDYFQIQSSRDLLDWISIGHVQSAGNSSQQLVYSFTDLFAHAGDNYYRIKQVDFNGQYEVFSPIAVNCEGINFEFSVFPNPTNHTFTLSIQSDQEIEDAEIVILDMTGKIIYQETKQISAGNSQFMIHDKFAAGTYSILIHTSANLFNPLKLVVTN